MSSMENISLHPVFDTLTVGRKSENLIKHNCRAKYIPQPDGTMRLASIQSFDRPLFAESGYEIADRAVNPPKKYKSDEADEAISSEQREEYIARAVRRAKVNAFDLILSNPDLDRFATFTVSPEAANRESWDECYNLMKVWLSNRVQRRGLKYVIVPEFHDDGKSIHFHGILNGDALNEVRARNPYGNLIYQKGKPVYNLSDVDFGFTTVKHITGENCREKVSKYIFKYMGKQLNQGARIGGRYFLHGGQLLTPSYVYADNISELLPDEGAKYDRECEVNGGIKYRELYYI